MIKLLAFAVAAVLTFGFTGTQAQAGGHGCYGYGGCARAYYDAPCARAWRPCKRLKLGRFFRKAPPCVRRCAEPVYVVRPRPVVVEVVPTYRPCRAYRGCGHW